MPTLHLMATPDDLDQLLQWGERVRLYAQLQGAYLGHLREAGFEEEHAFALVREWTTRTISWTVDTRHPAPGFGNGPFELIAPGQPPTPSAPPDPPELMGHVFHLNDDAARHLRAVEDPSTVTPGESYLVAPADEAADETSDEPCAGSDEDDAAAA